MKKILITGGAGFIGSHLCRRLLQDGHVVFCLDNLSSGSLSNIQTIKDDSNFTAILRDVCDEFFGDFDEIYNLACPASPIQYQNNPVKTVKTNVLGVINMLELTRRTGAKLLQASTSEIYGDPLEHPQSESYWGNVNTISRRSCYDEGKRCAETLLFDYHRQYKIKIKIARIFNTYGTRMLPDDGRVISNFIVQSLRGDDITIYGEGKQTRSFCFVDDLVEGLISLMNTNDDVTGPINLGNPTEITILKLAKKILKLIRGTSSLVFRTLPEDDPCLRCPDITLAREILNWEPKISLEEGLIRTVRYFENIIK